MLPVGDGNSIWWEMWGQPEGPPAVFLHGGPGSGSAPWARSLFDLSRYRLVQFDQRGCGRSTPHASDPATDLSTNTTSHLIADCELLRRRLGIDRWLVAGGSWGTTLGLAYAQAHPQRVRGLVLFSIGTTTPPEVEWITRTVARMFPLQWAEFVAAVPADQRNGNLAEAYRRLLDDPDPAVRERAAVAWCRWEDALASTSANAGHDPRYDDVRFRMAFARLVTHYFANAGFLDDGQLLSGTDRMAHVPAVLIHGLGDVSSPPDRAVQLAGRWPAAELVLIPGAGHGAAEPGMAPAIRAATDRLADGP
jgi:proline iminopeptidase